MKKIEKIDLFISYAHADKNKFFPNLTNALDEYGITYWLDEQRIGWGDSLFWKINTGLIECKFIVLLLTESYMSANWAKTELASAMQLEIRKGSVSVLPILASDTLDIYLHAPILAEKRYMLFNNLDKILLELTSLLEKQFITQGEFSLPAEYKGPVWMQCVKKKANLTENHHLRLSWGHWTYSRNFSENDSLSVYFSFIKANDGFSIPIIYNIYPECHVRFGVDLPPINSKVIDTNFDWRGPFLRSITSNIAVYKAFLINLLT